MLRLLCFPVSIVKQEKPIDHIGFSDTTVNRVEHG